ncbi:MAG: ZIP family metal transporter [Lautropia sp.]
MPLRAPIVEPENALNPWGRPTAVRGGSAAPRLGQSIVGGLILLGGLAALIDFGADWLEAADARLRLALAGGSFAALATALGAAPVAFAQTLSQRTFDAMLGFGAGVMLAATAFSLVVPGIEAARSLGAGPWRAAGTVGAGIVIGALALLAIDRLVPHEHFIKGLEGRAARALRRAWLFVFAIALHNLPEGLAIGVAAAGPDVVGARSLATGIAIQDVPEGLVVAVALVSAGYSRVFAVTLGVVSGLIEPIAAVLGAALIGVSAALLPWGLAMAAGAMLFVISHEIIPESHRQGHEAAATMGLVIGFVLMMTLDTALAG